MTLRDVARKPIDIQKRRSKSDMVKKILPLTARKHLAGSTVSLKLQGLIIRMFGRRMTPSETSKAFARRDQEGFFVKYCRGRGLDIGYGGDLLCANARGWDIEDGDAMLLSGLPDASFDFVYSSHTLEHMRDLDVALGNWWRVLKPNGYLILCLPHRDLYEEEERPAVTLER